jgi:predicted outer membrane protein
MALIAMLGQHDGKSLANTLVQLFDKAGITVNINVHLDSWKLLFSYSARFANCASNKMMMQWLKILQEHNIEFDPDNQSVMCFWAYYQS